MDYGDALTSILPLFGGVTKTATTATKALKGVKFDPKIVESLFKHFDASNIRSIDSSITGEAYKLGAKAATDPVYLKSISKFKVDASKQWRELMDTGNLDNLMDAAMNTQAARESFEAAISIKKGRKFGSVSEDYIKKIMSGEIKPINMSVGKSIGGIISGYQQGGAVLSPEMQRYLESIKGNRGSVVDNKGMGFGANIKESVIKSNRFIYKILDEVFKPGTPGYGKKLSGGRKSIADQIGFKKGGEPEPTQSIFSRIYEFIMSRARTEGESPTAAESLRRLEESEKSKHQQIREILGEDQDKDKIEEYRRGTPFVPEDQLAYIHKGEAVIPAEYNMGGIVRKTPVYDEGGVVNPVKFILKSATDIGEKIGEAAKNILNNIKLSVDTSKTLEAELTNNVVEINTESLERTLSDLPTALDRSMVDLSNRLDGVLSNLSNIGSVGADQEDKIDRFIEVTESKLDRFETVIEDTATTVVGLKDEMDVIKESSMDVSYITDNVEQLSGKITELESEMYRKIEREIDRNMDLSYIDKQIHDAVDGFKTGLDNAIQRVQILDDKLVFLKLELYRQGEMVDSSIARLNNLV
jgi:hypothetical protein